MIRSAKFFAIITLGFGAAAASCGDDSERSPSPGSGARAGSSGRGGASGSGALAGRSGAGSGAKAGASADAGSGGTLRGGGGGSGGKAGRTGGNGGARAQGGKGGGAGIATGAGGAPLAGAGGEGGARNCIAASAIKWAYTPQAGYEHIVGTYATQLAATDIAPSDTALALTLILPDTGSFPLGVEDNASLATCQQCLQAKVWNLAGADRNFFADEGELAIDASSDTKEGVIHASLSGVRLSEVTIDDDTSDTTPVRDGLCIELADGRIDVAPVSQGTGGEGGAGGAAGAAGAAGASGEGGASGAAPLPTDCIEVGVADDWQVYGAGDERSYFSALSPDLGSVGQDIVGLLVYSDSVGSVSFGQGVDATFALCEHCLLVNVTDGTGPDGGRNFFAMGGTLDIDASSQPLAGVMDATLSDVTLVELDYDYTPLTGGECLHLPSASFAVP